MDVTKSNFRTVLERLEHEIQQASFLSIDTEFTGLRDGHAKMYSLDTPAVRYRKVVKGSLQFLVIQFGLSIFQYNEINLKYENKTYNFYIFPNKSSLNGVTERVFLSQASSLAFLASQGFDFNKLIKEGIPYLNFEDEEKLRSNLKKRDKREPRVDKGSKFAMSQEEERYNNETMAKIAANLPEKDSGEYKELRLNCSLLQQERILSQLKIKFPSIEFKSRDQTPEGCTITFKNFASLSTTEENEIEIEREREEEKLIQDCVGFSKVLGMIQNSDKLVVGHNMLLDLCHILNQFCCPLPDDYEGFKMLTNTYFKRFIDTKVMATTKPFSDLLSNSALEPLLKSVTKAPFSPTDIVSSKNFPSYSLNDWKCHEAGFDAYITGVCFIAMANFLESTCAAGRPKIIGHNSLLITPFCQKIFMAMVPDIPYMNLSGPDLDPPRDHVFYVTFPKDWKLQDLFQLFKLYGTVRVDWTGDTSAFITLHRKENRHIVLGDITLPVGCTIKSYEAYLKDIEGGSDSKLPVKMTQSYEVALKDTECLNDSKPSAVATKKRASVSLPTTVARPAKKVCNKSTGKQKSNEQQFDVSNDWD